MKWRIVSLLAVALLLAACEGPLRVLLDGRAEVEAGNPATRPADPPAKPFESSSNSPVCSPSCRPE